jgi:hypothetical protein
MPVCEGVSLPVRLAASCSCLKLALPLPLTPSPLHPPPPLRHFVFSVLKDLSAHFSLGLDLNY